MARETIGSSISPDVSALIKAREEIFGARNRTKQQLEFLNSNTAWVKLRSSVNKISNDEALTLAKLDKVPSTAPGVSTIAKNMILVGGAIRNDNNSNDPAYIRGGINTGVKSTASNNNAYHNSEVQGIRPMPGITSLKVTSKNPYGTLQEAVVDFKVWSREDLDDIELIYFRVGYSALVEYGHSVYTTTDGKIKSFSSADTVPDSVWFANNNFSTVVSYIKKNKFDKPQKGNYNAVFGFITNFQWKARNDGGYDCMVKIISKGVILEALQNPAATNNVSNEDIEKKDTEQSKDERRSLFHFIFRRLLGQEDGEFKMSERATYNNSKSVTKQLADRDLYKIKLKVGGFPQYLNILNSSLYLLYLPLGLFFEILHVHLLPKTPNGEPIIKFDFESVEKFRTFDSHFSVNPLVAIPPRPPKGKFKYCKADFDEDSRDPQLIHSTISSKVGSDYDHIMNIHVTSEFILKQIEELTEGNIDDGVGIMDFVNSIIGGVQNALGNVNDFRLFYDEDDNIWSVVDGSNPEPLKKKQEIKTINVTGLSNTVSNLSVNSTISSEMASMVAIAAQGGTGNYKQNLNNILSFNRGAVDRHMIAKTQNSNGKEVDKKQIEDKEPTFDESWKEVWENLQAGGVFLSGTIDPDLWSKLETEAKTVLQSFNNKKVFESPVQVDPAPIPLEFNMTLLGISNLKIGQAFRINDSILPKKYKNVTYYIKGLDHEIGSDNRWVTNISARMSAVGS